MCGIAGIVRIHASADAPPANEAIPDAWLDLLDESILHRGPDGAGRFRDRAVRAGARLVDVALVHRRLSILDHEGGAQPLVTGEGPDLQATVFNGCIYNHRDLRRELESLGRRFVTHHSDTEVIPHAHAAWGDHAPARLDGMFVYAVWSRADATLRVARDFAGEKPLYEAALRHPRLGSTYVFASTAMAVTRWLRRFGEAIGSAGLSCNRTGLAQWLRFGGSLVPLLNEVDECDVRVVSAFSSETNDKGDSHDQPRREWYADLPERRSDAPSPTAEQVDALLGRAVRSRLDADVPLGCFLSGGVDSSLVAFHARRALGSLRTFTVRMPDARYDESEPAALAARVVGSDHATLDCDARPSEQLPMLIGQLGLPIADSSLLPTYWVSRAAREHVKVALTGDAGDELFAGYERHGASSILRRWRAILALAPGWLEGRAHPKSVRSKLARLGVAARGGYQELLAIFPREMLSRLAPELNEPLSRLPIDFPLDAPRWDFQWYLPGVLLRKTDTAAMSVALETRTPFLARELVEFGLAEHQHNLTRGGRKGLLRAAARLHLPSDIIERPKMGFAIPIGEWFRNDFGSFGTLLRDELASSDPFPQSLLRIELNRGYVSRMLDDHMTRKRDHSQRLYSLLVLALWCREVGRRGR